MFARFLAAGLLFLISGCVSLSAQDIRLITPEKIDFGRIQEDQPIEGKIQFVNGGSVPIEIERIYASCGCTTTQVKKMRYNSGDTAAISFSVRTRGFRGIIRKSITIYFKEPAGKELDYTIQATVHQELEITPAFVNFQSVRLNPDTLLTEFVRIRNNTDKPIQLKNLFTDNDLVTVMAQPKIIPSGQTAEVRVSLRPSKTAIRDIEISIETDNSRKPIIIIPVFLFIEKRP
jgi:hypothetical protein